MSNSWEAVEARKCRKLLINMSIWACYFSIILLWSYCTYTAAIQLRYSPYTTKKKRHTQGRESLISDKTQYIGPAKASQIKILC